MIDAFGHELNVGDTVIHAYRDYTSIKVKRGVVLNVGQHNVQVEFVVPDGSSNIRKFKTTISHSYGLAKQGVIQ